MDGPSRSKPAARKTATDRDVPTAQNIPPSTGLPPVEDDDDPDSCRRTSSAPPRDVDGTALPLGQFSNFQLLRRMFQFIKPVRGLAVLVCLLVAVGVLLEVAGVDLTRVVLNRISLALGHPSTPGGASIYGTILILVGLLGGLVALSGVNSFFSSLANTKLGMNMVFHMRATVYDQLQRVGFSFHDQHSSGQLINRALSDLSNIRQFVNNALVSLVQIAAYVIGYNILIAAINPWAGLAALLPIPFWLWYIQRFSRKIQPIQRRLMTTGDNLVTVYSENVAGVHVVKACATEPTEIKKYFRLLDAMFGQVLTTVGMWANFIPVIRGIATASNLTLFFIGALLAAHGYLHPGDILVLGVAMGAILGRLQQINVISNQYQTAVVSARRFFEVLYAAPNVPELPHAPPLPPGPGLVEFSFVTFGYDPAKPVVRDISFDVEGGSVVALVGPTGAGKSTLMQLLARFYDPQSGVILIDNVDIRKVALNSLRQNIGFVFQETFLFSDTIANNIRYGNPHASDAQVEAAARLAQAHDFIMELPQHYDTTLGERGTTLSGGQKQRLSIARAIVTNPRILVLDDALAAVDPRTEHLIRRALELVLRDRTVFIIAHRLSTVQQADLVIVLENGRITEAGRHEELMRQYGLYREIAELQLRG